MWRNDENEFRAALYGMLYEYRIEQVFPYRKMAESVRHWRKIRISRDNPVLDTVAVIYQNLRIRCDYDELISKIFEFTD